MAGKSNLWRHTKTCLARKEYYKPHPAEHDEDNKPKRIMAVKRGESLVNTAIFSAKDSDVMIEVLSRMRCDEIKDIVASDDLICHEVSLSFCALGKKVDQKHDDIYRVTQAARTLGRLLAFARDRKPQISMSGLLCPKNFDLVVEVAKQMSTDKETPALTVGKQIGLLLKKLCQDKYCMSLRSGDRVLQDDATNFEKLVDREWNSRVNRAASKRLNTERRLQQKVIPLTDDLQTFRQYVIDNVRELSSAVQSRANPNPHDWVSLAKFTMTRLILFNKRRRAEVRELRVDEYLGRPRWNSDNASGELAMALSETDRLLAQRYTLACFQYWDMSVLCLYVTIMFA